VEALHSQPPSRGIPLHALEGFAHKHSQPGEN